MSLIKKAKEIIEHLNSESDEATDRFIDKEYNGLMQMSTIYLKLDKKYLPLSCTQIVVYFIVSLYHWIFLLKTLVLCRDQNFVLYSKCAFFFMLFQVSFLVVIIATMKHKQIALFHKRMSRNFYDYEEPKSPVVEQLRTEMLKERSLIVMIPIGTSICALLLFILAPRLDREFGTYEESKGSAYVNINLPVPLLAYPFSTDSDLGYYCALIPQMMGGFILPLVIGCGGYVYIVMSENLSMQLKILIDSLERVESRTAHYYYKLFGQEIKYFDERIYADPKFAYCLNKCLKKNFEHHQIILSSFDILKEIMSIPIFLAYLTGTAVIALSLLSNNVRELPGTTVSSLLLVCVEIGYMALFSALGQRITDLSADIRVKVYNIKWYYGDNHLKGSIRIIMAMTLKPMTLISGGIMPVNLDTFAKVMNTAYSYYNLVNAFDTT